MRTLLFADNLTLWTLDVEDPRLYLHTDRPAFMTLRAIDEALKATPVMRAATWLLIDVVILAFAWRRRETPEGAFAIGACGSAAVYVLTFFAVGVAPDFRYAYWAVLAAIASAAVMLSAPRKMGDKAC
jgi:di/tricarboxylate transporter